MNETSAEIAGRWDRENRTATSGDSFNELHIKLDFLERLHYRQYLPTVAAVHPNYWARFNSWLRNVPDEADQRILFELAINIAYFRREEFTQLYQSAFRGPILSWLVEKLGCQLNAPNLEERTSDELARHTWYCPLTDSMPISDFCHTNNLGGIRLRPDWVSLAKFGDRTRILDFMNNHEDAKRAPCPLRRIVILEDFVGSGTQMLENHRVESGRAYNALAFAASLSATIPVLFVPLIICPVGMHEAQRLKAPNFETRPVLELKNDEFIDKNAVLNGQLPNLIADLARRSYTLVKGKKAANPLYSPFGVDTGAMVVMYSNTPANTLPMIQHFSDQWAPLFPRSARIK